MSRQGMSRRMLVSGAVMGALAAGRGAEAAGARSPADLRVNPERLRATLEGLSLYGRKLGGSFADGVSRYA